MPLMRRMLIYSLTQAVSQEGLPSALSTPPSSLSHLGKIAIHCQLSVYRTQTKSEY